MKKSLSLFLVGGLLLSFSLQTFGKEQGIGMSLGFNAGGFPFILGTEYGNIGMNSMNYGGELGIQFSRKIIFRAEISVASVSSRNLYENESNYRSYSYSYSHTSKITYSVIPITGTLLYRAPINPYLSTHVGIGFGYYPISLKSEWQEDISYEYYYGSGSDSDKDKETENFDGFAPHFSAGVELLLGEHFVVFSDIRHIVGKTKYEYRSGGSHSVSDIHFGGTSVRIGIRFYSSKQRETR